MLPPELADLVGRKGLPLERMRRAVATLEQRREPVTNRAVRKLAGVNAAHVPAVLAAWRGGRLPSLQDPWDATPAPPEDPKPAPATKRPEAQGEAPDHAADEAERKRVAAVVEELVAQVQGAGTIEQLAQLGRRRTVELLRGTVTPRVAELVQGALKHQQRLLEAAQAEREASLSAIEVLTPGEVEALAAYRRSIAPRPVPPGEAVPPP